MDNLLPDTKIAEVLGILEQMHPEASCALDHGNEFELLISVVLSAQTTDVSVNKVTPALFAAYPDPAALAAADRQHVEELIRTIGLYRNKSANIIRLADRLLKDFGGIVPNDFDSLVSLPGVGRKTANVVLAEGFGVPRIAVDTHVFRVSNRIGLTDGKDVTEVEEMLMRRIPRDQWIKTHHMLIFHGRRCCTARRPRCADCGLRDICLGAEL
ncbi:MAG: endonuclease III [Mogibacterium sp.]|nr:endonuclease III [Mogibacterium sp.]